MRISEGRPDALISPSHPLLSHRRLWEPSPTLRDWRALSPLSPARPLRLIDFLHLAEEDAAEDTGM
jgi:hypothetical protein